MKTRTDREVVSKEMLARARKSAAGLREWMEDVLEAMDRHESGAFPQAWCDTMMERALGVFCDVARANGAVLVRSISEETE